MKIRTILIVSALFTGTTLAQPIPKSGSCPTQYLASGGYCIPTEGAKPVVIKNEDCPTGYLIQGNYCTPMNNAPLAIPKIGNCPTGYLINGNYCVKY